MTDRPMQDDTMWREAMDHVLAARASPGDLPARAAAERWRRQSAAHDRLYREAESVWTVAGALPPAHADSWGQPKRARIMSRRRVLAAGGALAAGIAAVAAIPPALEILEGGERTGSGETRQLRLADGSRVTLGPESIVEVAVDPRRRAVTLVRGVAFFDVAPDAGRPFVVTSDGLTVRVVGTAFEVRNRGGELSVAVDHGRVEVSSDRPPLLPAETLDAGDWVSLRRESGAIERGAAEPNRIAVWRDRMIVVERRPVRAVVEEIAAWYDGRIIILDSALGDRLVSGVYDLENPVAAVEALVGPFGGRVYRVTPWLVLLAA